MDTGPEILNRLLDHLGNKVQTGFDLRRTLLEALALITFRRRILAKTQVHIEWMRHGLDARGIDGIHLLDQPEYPGKTVRVAPCLLLIDLESRKMRYLFYFAIINSHKLLPGHSI